ncbi:MAG: hypothetical protein MJ223_02585 [Mycoplasmoidaceae bacterium]|nr:hypothetical protein [Mycoplasmoidaceae bacterium]
MANNKKNNMISTDPKNLRKFCSIPRTFDAIVDFNSVAELVNFCYRSYNRTKAICKPDGKLASYKEVFNDIVKAIEYFKSLGLEKQNIGLICSNGFNLFKWLLV